MNELRKYRALLLTQQHVIDSTNAYWQNNWIMKMEEHPNSIDIVVRSDYHILGIEENWYVGVLCNAGYEDEFLELYEERLTPNMRTFLNHHFPEEIEQGLITEIVLWNPPDDRFYIKCDFDITADRVWHCEIIIDDLSIETSMDVCLNAIDQALRKFTLKKTVTM